MGINRSRRFNSLEARIPVMEKKPERKLRKQDIIPKKIEGIPTDMVESGEIRAL